MRLRQIFVIGLALSLLGIGVPAWAQDDPKNCNDLMAADTPAYVVCRWMATPEEAADIARFWLDNDGEHLQEAGPLDPIVIDCTEPGNVCPTGEDGDGDGIPRDAGDPDVEGAEDGGTPECKEGESCYVNPARLSQAEIAQAEKTAAGQAVQAAAKENLRIWINAELTGAWKDGKLDAAVRKLAALAVQPGVAGIRFTTQLGFDQTFKTADEIDKFVAETSAALRKLAPGKKLAVHTVVPVLGCGADEACKTEMTKKHPLSTPERVGAWLSKGQIDQLALDSGLLATEYATWKIDAVAAQRNQWIQVRARAWDAYGQIASEDAGFAATGASKLTTEQTTQAINDRIAIPLQTDAAETVTLWSRWKDEQGQVSRTFGEKWATNATWDQLKKLTSVRPRLATVYDPANPEVDPATDMKNLAEVFGQVYVHAGA
ncbi:hypothetical protein [Nonomuraea cavernae]|uniref:hypothetical protein n=1 Tax=Nonomuraea cavernae TaxID=2045107 RepID=UPI0033E60FED